MKKIIFTALILLLISITVFFTHTEAFYLYVGKYFAAPITSITHPLFIKENIIEESTSPADSKNEMFWLNSGAFAYLDSGVGRTIQGDLSKYSHWRILYSKNNPLDTDDGYHPQNLFRFLTVNDILNTEQILYVKINRDNLSDSPQRNETNGVFLIQRHLDSQNLYYTGIRVDGTAVIKKKIKGVYTTLAQASVYYGDPYDKKNNPSLLPKDTWIGLKSKIKNLPDKKGVTITLQIDKDNTHEWTEIASVTDIESAKNEIIAKPGQCGIRSDFMDIDFKDYEISPLLD